MPDLSNAKSRAVTVVWDAPSIPGWGRTTSRVVLIDGYTTEADIPNILSIGRIGARNAAPHIQILSITPEEE